MSEETLNPNNDKDFETINPVDLDSLSSQLNEREDAEDQDFLNQFVETGRDEAIVPESEVEKETSDKDDEDAPDAPDSVVDLTAEDLDKSISEAEKNELEELNKKLGTDFKDLNELKTMIHKEDNQEQGQQIEEKRNLLNYYETIITKTPREIIFEDERAKAYQSGKDLKDQDIIDEINYKIDDMEDKGTLEYASRTIVAELNTASGKLKTEVESYDSERKETQENKIKEKKSAIEKAAINMYSQDDFFGLKLEKQSFINAYRKVTKGDTIKLIEKDPRLAIEVQLFLDNRKGLSSLNNSATYSDGIKDTIDAVNGHGPKERQTVRNNKRSNGDVSSFISDFLK